PALGPVRTVVLLMIATVAPSRAPRSSPAPAREPRSARGMPIEEAEDLGVVDAGEGAGRQRREHVRVQPGARPRPPGPVLRERHLVLVAQGPRSPRVRPHGRVATAEPFRVL